MQLTSSLLVFTRSQPKGIVDTKFPNVLKSLFNWPLRYENASQRIYLYRGGCVAGCCGVAARIQAEYKGYWRETSNE